MDSQVNSSNEGGIKSTAAAYFLLKCNVKCMKGPGNGASKNDLLLLLHVLAVAAACSMALLPAPCGHAEIQIQGVEVKCSCVAALFFLHADAGAEPKILHCTSKRCNCKTLTQEVDAFSQC